MRDIYHFANILFRQIFTLIPIFILQFWTIITLVTGYCLLESRSPLQHENYQKLRVFLQTFLAFHRFNFNVDKYASLAPCSYTILGGFCGSRGFWDVDLLWFIGWLAMVAQMTLRCFQ